MAAITQFVMIAVFLDPAIQFKHLAEVDLSIGQRKWRDIISFNS